MLSSCGVGTSSPPIADPEAMAASGIDFSVELDEATGRIVLPYDRFVPNLAEGPLLHNAAATAATLCMRDLGVPVTEIRQVPQDIYLSEHFYGPWTIEQAQEFGFVEPAPDADLRANGFLPEGQGEPSVYDHELWEEVAQANAKIPLVEKTAAQKSCQSEIDRWNSGFDGPWKDEMAQDFDHVGSSPEFESLLDELGSCFNERNLEADLKYPYRPKGADFSTINEEQIRLAIVTVECKEKIDFTERATDLFVQFQAPIMLQYEKELIAHRQGLQESLGDAKELVSAYPEVFQVPE